MKTECIVRDLALVGAGYWGKNLARNFNNIGVLRTLCDSDRSVLDLYSSEYENIEKVTDFDFVIGNPEIRKVVIAVPAVAHYNFAKKALIAGKDVFVEKPLCLTTSEAEELVALAFENKKILMVGHLLHYHPFIRVIKQIVASGELGRICYINSNRLNLGKIRYDENALWSLAPHDISVILSIMGNQLPTEVNSYGKSIISGNKADNSLIIMDFANDVRAQINVSWLNPQKEQKLTIIGTLGMAVFDDGEVWARKLKVFKNCISWRNGQLPYANKTDGVWVEVPEAEPLRAECESFLESCKSRSNPITDGKEGLRVLMVLQAAQASLESRGRTIFLKNNKPQKYYSHPTAVIDTKASIGDGTKIWHFSHIMDNAIIGNNCNIGQNVLISTGVKLGSNVKVQNNVSIYTGTIVEDDVFLGPSCVLTNVTNPRSQINRQSLYEDTIIRRGASIGANATIVCGVVLGKYCFIGAGSVVTKDVPDYALVYGNPARFAGWVSRHGHRISADSNGVMICPESKLRYKVNSEGQVRCLDIDENDPLPNSLSKGIKSYNDIRVIDQK